MLWWCVFYPSASSQVSVEVAFGHVNKHPSSDCLTVWNTNIPYWRIYWPCQSLISIQLLLVFSGVLYNHFIFQISLRVWLQRFKQLNSVWARILLADHLYLLVALYCTIHRSICHSPETCSPVLFVQFHFSLYGASGGQSDTATSFSPNSRPLPCQYHYFITDANLIWF